LIVAIVPAYSSLLFVLCGNYNTALCFKFNHYSFNALDYTLSYISPTHRQRVTLRRITTEWIPIATSRHEKALINKSKCAL